MSFLKAIPTMDEKVKEAEKIPNEGEASWTKLMVFFYLRDSRIIKLDWGMFSNNLTIIPFKNLFCGLSKASLLWEYPISSLIYSIKN